VIYLYAEYFFAVKLRLGSPSLLTVVSISQLKQARIARIEHADIPMSSNVDPICLKTSAGDVKRRLVSAQKHRPDVVDRWMPDLSNQTSRLCIACRRD